MGVLALVVVGAKNGAGTAPFVVAAALDALRAGWTYSFARPRSARTAWPQVADIRSYTPYVYGSATARSEVSLVRHDRKRTRVVPHEELSSARAFFEVLQRDVTAQRC